MIQAYNSLCYQINQAKHTGKIYRQSQGIKQSLTCVISISLGCNKYMRNIEKYITLKITLYISIEKGLNAQKIKLKPNNLSILRSCLLFCNILVGSWRTCVITKRTVYQSFISSSSSFHHNLSFLSPCLGLVAGVLCRKA